jgi:sigma-B regulation protein RsbU (phosphoserine phosphatase)
MTISELEHFKSLLTEKEENLAELLATGACCNAVDERRVHELLDQIREALSRVKNHSYGECTVCHEEVEKHRLEVQPIQSVCLGCISDQERELLEDELFVASKIHRALLPQHISKIEGVELVVRSLAASSIGGDYYDILPASNGGLTRVVIADSMGKGIPAGLLMSNLQGALRILAEDMESPGALVTRLNHWLCRNVPVIKFVSLACIGLKPENGNGAEAIWVNAGHCPPILLRKDGSVERLNPTGAVLGVHQKFTFEERQTHLAQGDLMLLYTDGVTEAENDAGEMFEEERLIDFVKNHRSDSPSKLLDDLVDRVREFSKEGILADDLTVIAFRITG